jgi:two-component system sensor histidine kinase MtrB
MSATLVGAAGSGIANPSQDTARIRKPNPFGRLWGSSLPLRIIVTTVAASVVVLLLGAWMILTQARDGVLEGKRQISVNEASTALSRMQEQLSETDLRDSSLFERLNQLAVEQGSSEQSYQVLIQGPVSVFISREISADSVPNSLRDQVNGGDGLWVTPTLIKYQDSSRADEPGLAIGGNLHSADSLAVPVYFVFPYTQEVQTLAVVEQAVWSTTAALVVALAVIAYLVSRQVTGPIRLAGEVASQIAGGDFDQRLPVRGSDDLASLATSMNGMAAELGSQIDELESLSRVQQQFVSDVSHELRTPLTTMRMATDVLHDARDELNPTMARTVELLHREVERFEAMLIDLLEISRFDAGAAVLNLELTDVSDLVREELAEDAAIAMKLGVALELDAPIAQFAEVDARRVRRIVRNLVSNALEYAEGNPVRVRVAGNDRAVAILVRDNGAGFSADAAAHIFSRFWRADPARQRTLGGTGLGLSISQEDAKLHHGRIDAWGKPGEGAAFLVTLPRKPGTDPGEPPLALPDGAPVVTLALTAGGAQ